MHLLLRPRAAAGCPSRAAIARYRLLAGRSAANPPHVVAAVDGLDRQTDGNRTDTYTLLRTMPAVSVINERLAPKDFRSQF